MARMAYVPLVGCFNPRAREGRDVLPLPVGACNRGFNPRAREGRDPQSKDAVKRYMVFQSTRPRGARRDAR